MTYLPYFCLMMTFASLWIHKSAWLWGAFLALAFSLAVYLGSVQLFSLVVLALLFLLFWILKNPIAGGKRHFLTLTAIGVAAALSYHIVPGFHNLQITPAFYLNFDKPLIGLFPLVFLVPLAQTRDDWIKVGLKALPLTLIFIFALAAIALSTGIIEWNMKLPSHFFLRTLSNMFLTVIPEESFFRGFLQKEIANQLGNKLLSRCLGVAGASLVFTLFYLTWTASPAMLAVVFLAGLLYGAIYELTGSLEGSILCHFGVNMLHMLLFSYHAE